MSLLIRGNTISDGGLAVCDCGWGCGCGCNMGLPETEDLGYHASYLFISV